MNLELPIYAVAGELVEAVRARGKVVLTAPTGSGKTTQVPQILYREGLSKGHIVVLQPRRLATRLVAERVAQEMGTRTGELVGYQTRHDSRVSGRSVVRFMTEGLFLRMMQSNPSLEGVGAVVLDEFHERSLAADTALAMVRTLQRGARADLKVVVMSATLDAARVGEYLDAPAVEAQGRMFPVALRYMDKRVQDDVWELAADALAHVIDAKEPGDVLIFMPGAYEIRRTIEVCQRHWPGLGVFALHGELPPREQDLALAPLEGGARKVIVSTNVAETSITIPGIRHVIDSGLARVNRFDPRRGINVLLIEPISMSSAQQRAGRAGRTAPGTCTRLWTEADNRGRAQHDSPEVKRLDLAEVVLQLKSYGVERVREFGWLEPPESASLEQAMRVLGELGAIEAAGERMTALGATMARLPMHPRLSRLMVEAHARGVERRAALWAALISERDILVKGAKADFPDALTQPPTDFAVMEAALEFARKANFDVGRCSSKGIHAGACRELERTRGLFMEACEDAGLEVVRKAAAGRGAGNSTGDSTGALVKSLLVAFGDHVAMRTSTANLSCAVVGGRRGQLDPNTVVRGTGPVVAVEIRETGAGGGVKTVLSMVSGVEVEWLGEVHPGRVTRGAVTVWNDEMKCAERVERVMYEDLVVWERMSGNPDAAQAAELLAEQVLRGGLKLELWDEGVEQWICRARFVGSLFPERRLITYAEEDVRLIVEELCAGAVRYSQVKDRPVLQFFKDAMSWEDQQFVERMAPDRIELPRGWGMKVEYSAGAPPRGRAKIQDFYGLEQGPMIAGGRHRLLLEILGPNFRPVQLTDDLAGFWTNLYPTLRKELSRKYPRHEWR